MLPNPIHPAIVHFPIVLMFLLPIAAGYYWLRARRGAAPRRSWTVPAFFAGALALSAWVAVQTGEAQEERIERVIAENVLHAHEEPAEAFLLISAFVLFLALLGYLRAPFGTAARILASSASVVALVAGVLVGATGGDLVYKHGAAAAYAQPATQSGDDDESAARTNPAVLLATLGLTQDRHAQIPSSIRTEHGNIQEGLQAAIKKGGPVGAAARQLNAVLKPHFEREEQLALPPLALLKPLAESWPRRSAHYDAALADSLRKEWPRMVTEHIAIKRAVMHLERVAGRHSDWTTVSLTKQLSLHAQQEEDVLYPAAVLASLIAADQSKAGALSLR